MINLLPPSYKKEIRSEERWRIILNLEIFLFAFLVCLSLILLSVKINVQGLKKVNMILVEAERKTIEFEEERQVSLGIEDLEVRIARVNRELPRIASFFRAQTDLASLLEDLAGVLPPGSFLTAFSRPQEDSKVTLFGSCPDRDSLYQLKEALEEKESFGELEFPSSNWLDPSNFAIYLKYNHERE